MTGMFDGDQSSAGRRERLLKMRDSKEAFTGKVGGAEISNGKSNMSNGFYPTPTNTGRSLGVASGGPQASRGGGAAAALDHGGAATYLTTSAGTIGSGLRSTRSGNVTPSITGSTTGEGFEKETASTGNFRQRVQVKRSTYELDIFCKFPIIDFMQNTKQRQFTFVCACDEQGECTDKYSVQIPQAFEFSRAKVTNDDFSSGRVSIVLPAVERNALSWD
ncbi:unnamed protein product [Amoebophrya sp. A25]|nr:unnamed protein product [Amoebophrya sp. A25]|eukprot:GSA25T00016196001.1